MANESQAAPPTRRAEERTPLLRPSDSPGDNGGLSHINHRVKTWRRRRWISFAASIFLLLGFVAILILSGGKCAFLGADPRAPTPVLFYRLIPSPFLARIRPRWEC